MNSFKRGNIKLPLGSVWLMNFISEYKGKQDLYNRQSPQVLKALMDLALIESTESSNRIEGVTVEKSRLKPLVLGHSKPRDRSEEEVAGYRKALELLHTKYKSLRITPGTIKELHRLSHSGAWDAGKWKEKDNDIIRKNQNGSIGIIFKPVTAKQTPKAMEQLFLAYENSINQLKYPPLYAIACLTLDFLCIHPFRDGNGRVSRLLTLLVLYQHGFTVGKYISIERIIEQSKETYYEVLNKSSKMRHESKHDVMPWFHYFLGTVLSAYKEFEERVGNVKIVRGAKTNIVESVVSRQHGEFSISDIERECTNVSRIMIKKVLDKMQKENKIKSLGKGRSAKWKRMV
ncbi:MAG: Fic family protein [Elusimicrobiota bacterium]